MARRALHTRMKRLLLSLLFVGLLSGWGGRDVPPAEAVSPRLKRVLRRAIKRAIRLYNQMKFPQALKILQALTHAPGLSRQERAKVYLYQGFCLFYVFTPAVAKKKFRKALKLAPGLQAPPQTPPSLLRLLALERAQMGLRPARRRPIQRRASPSPRPHIQLQAPRPRIQLQVKLPLYPGQPLLFQGRCSTRRAGQRLYVLLRRRDQVRYKALPLQWQEDRCSGQITNPYPSNHRGPAQLSYVFQVRDGQRVILTHPPLTQPIQLTLMHRTPPVTPPKKSRVGLVVGLTLGATALVAGGVVLALYLLNQPTGPSLEVTIQLNAGGSP